MNLKAASLTSALLVAKGGAAPTGAAPRFEPADNVQPLPMRLRPRAGGDGQTRLSLRMNSARHLRLRLAAAHLGRSSHALMVAAIDHYLDNVLPPLLAGHCACLEQGRAPDGACAAMGFGRSPLDQKQ